MFLEGLKFALGFVAGMSILSGLLILALAVAELFAHWRKKRRCRLWETKARGLQRVMPQIREHAVFCFRFRTDDWIPTRDKTKYLR